MADWTPERQVPRHSESSQVYERRPWGTDPREKNLANSIRERLLNGQEVPLAEMETLGMIVIAGVLDSDNKGRRLYAAEMLRRYVETREHITATNKRLELQWKLATIHVDKYERLTLAAERIAAGEAAGRKPRFKLSLPK